MTRKVLSSVYIRIAIVSILAALLALSSEILFVSRPVSFWFGMVSGVMLFVIFIVGRD